MRLLRGFTEKTNYRESFVCILPCFYDLDQINSVDSSMRETSDDEVDYGSYGDNTVSLTVSDHAWSTYMKMIVKTK